MIERILAHYGYVKVGSRAWESSDPKDHDKVTRANRWLAFYREQGGLADFIKAIRTSYFEKIASLKPGDVDGLQTLAMADKVARELDQHIRAVIDAGVMEAHYKEHADRIAALPEAQRRRL